MVLLKPRRTFSEFFYGVITLASLRLYRDAKDLENHLFMLTRRLHDGTDNLSTQPFVRRLILNYETNARSELYLYAGSKAQINYDRKWHAIGFVIKKYQQKGVIARDAIPLDEIEKQFDW